MSLSTKQQRIVNVLAALSSGGLMASTGAVRESLNEAYGTQYTALHGSLVSMWRKGLIECYDGGNGIDYWSVDASAKPTEKVSESNLVTGSTDGRVKQRFAVRPSRS